MTQNKVAIVGGGAAGYFAAINIAEKNPRCTVHLFEATSKPLTKVKISGGGRCNVTHQLFDPIQLSKNYPRGHRELKSVFSKFQPQDTIHWFAKRGVELHAEKDGRMFPTSNKSSTIIDCFQESAKAAGVQVNLKSKIENISKTPEGFALVIKDQSPQIFAKVVLATGSAPFGHTLINQLGHSLTSLAPSLFTFKIQDALLHDMAGTAFKDCLCELKVNAKGKAYKFKQRGPMLITHWGLSGPVILKLSAYAARELHSTDYKALLKVNFFPEHNSEQILHELKVSKQKLGHQSVQKNLFPQLTKRMHHQFLLAAGIDLHSTWSHIQEKNLKKLAQILTQKDFHISGKGVFKEEFVTCGGVNLKEIDFKKMESKICPGLFFAGEILDIDGITGGFNFQNAWSTAWIISEAIA